MEYIPKVSVVVPTYNYARFLDEAIQSVLDQTFTDFELIIVDNCSTDNTDGVVKKYLADNRVTFHKNETNLGLIGNWNRCLELARGEYIKFLCADDKFHPQILEKFVALMEQFPDVAIVSSHNEVFERKNVIRRPPFTGRVSGKVARESLLYVKSWLYGPTASMFRKRDADKVGVFDARLFRVVDREFFMRLLTLGDCYIIPEVLSYIRAHGGTQTSMVNKKKYQNTIEWYKFAIVVNEASTPETDLSNVGMKELIRWRASGCVSVLFRLLPRLHKKENRKLFREAFQIGYKEGVLLAPFSYYLQRKYGKKPFRKPSA